MPQIEYLDAETCTLRTVDVELEVSLAMSQHADIWMRCGYLQAELRRIGWQDDNGDLAIQTVPVSIVTGRNIA